MRRVRHSASLRLPNQGTERLIDRLPTHPLLGRSPPPAPTVDDVPAWAWSVRTIGQTNAIRSGERILRISSKRRPRSSGQFRKRKARQAKT